MKYIGYFCVTAFLFLGYACTQEKYVGSLIDYTGEKNGKLKSYYENGNLYEEAQFDNGKIDGYRKIYFEDGSGVMIHESYADDVYHGTYEKFYANGKTKVKGKYENGSMEGVWTAYYPSGAIKDEVAMHANLENGPFKEYHENGAVKAIGAYKDGEQEHGPLQLFDESGTLIKKMDCNMGVCRTTWKLEEG